MNDKIKDNLVYHIYMTIHFTESINIIDDYLDLYFSREDAISAGKKFINTFIMNNCNSIEEFFEKYTYEFGIYVINLNRIDESIRSKNVTEYYYKYAPQEKSKLYNFLTTIADTIYESYDYNGNFKYGIMYAYIKNLYDIGISYKSKFEPTDLKIGDLVKKKGYDKIYKVYRVPLYDEWKQYLDIPLIYMDTVSIGPIDFDEEEDDLETYSCTELIKID